MVAGAITMTVGFGVRAGTIPIGSGGVGDPLATAGPYGDGPAATEVASDVSPAPDPATEAPAESDPTTPGVGTLWFADAFDTVGAWPTGQLDWVTTSVADGLYRIEAQPTDLPVILTGTTGEGSPGTALTMSVRLAIPTDADPATSAGLVMEDAEGTRIMALVLRDGRVALLRDSIESLDLIASGAITPSSAMIDLSISLVNGSATVSADGEALASAQASIVPISFGLAVWAASKPATIDVDSYAIRVDDVSQP